MLILCATLALCLQTADAAGDAILSCKNPYGSSRIEIIENPSRRGAILRWHTHTGIDTYRIEERTPAYYRFVEADPKTPDSASPDFSQRVEAVAV